MRNLLILLSCLFLSIGAKAQFSGTGSGTESDPYLILNPIQLDQMRNFLNKKVFFELKNDIDLTDFIEDNYPDEGWLPIGNSVSRFEGTLKGNNHTISGLTINRPSAEYVGLFGYTIGANISGLNISGAVDGKKYVGILAGLSSESTIKDCTIYVLNNKHINASYVGGLIGCAWGMISDNTVYGNIDANQYVGGVVGGGGTELRNCKHEGDVCGTEHVGGIVGGGSGMNCTNKGNIRNTGDYTGGIAGECNGELTDCWAFGDISGRNYVGGLVGRAPGSRNYPPKISNCFCVGDIIGEDYVGGLLGSVGCTNATSSYYNGSITGKNNVGGIAGYCTEGPIEKCYSYATIIGTDNVGGILGNAYGKNVKINACVANNIRVSSTTSNCGRIYGGGVCSVGTLGSSADNLAYNQGNLVVSGVTQKITDSDKDGRSVGASMLRLSATYVAKGWDFNNDWDIQETECLPYKRYQAAPPVIESELCSGATGISGKSVNGGTVFLFYKNNSVVSTQSVGNSWSFSTESLQPGAQVRVYTEAAELAPSYMNTASVGFLGSGKENDPYRIYTADDLQGVSKRGYYKLMNDIDLTEWIAENNPTGGWIPVGRTGSETTYIDGDGHIVSGLWIDSTEDWTGLFSNFDSGIIKNLTVETKEGKKVKGGDYTGILIGRNSNGRIENCTVKGTVEGTVRVGGIAGLSENDVIAQCRAIDIDVVAKANEANVGGAFGVINGSEVNSVMSRGNVTATGSGARAGGLIGTFSGGVTDSYSTANVCGTEYTGGLVGYSSGTINRCYAKGDVVGVKKGGGVVAQMEGGNAATTNSVAANNIIRLSDQSAWGSRVIGGYMSSTPDPDGSNFALKTMQVSLNDVPQKKTDDIVEGASKTESELKTAQTYVGLGWDMSKTWCIDEGNNYPVFAWEKDVTLITSLSLSQSSLTIKEGDSATLTAVVLPEDATNKSLIWTSSNSNVAIVKDGVVTAVASGKAVIKVETVDGSGVVATCEVTVTASTSENPSGDVVATDISKYDNVVFFEEEKQFAGRQITLPLMMNNSAEITAMQFDLVLPEGITLDKNAKGKYALKFNADADRTDASVHTLSSSLQSDGSIRVLCYSNDKDAISGNSGAVIDFPITIAETIEPDEYPIILKNVILTATDKSEYKIPEVVCKLIVPDYEMGDVNGDEEINVTDIVYVADYILGNADPDFNEKAADMNEDNEINVTDIVFISDVILNGSNMVKASNAAKAVSRATDNATLTIEAFAIEKGKSKTVTMDMTNHGREVTAFQCNLILPEGITIDKNSKGKYKIVFNADTERTDATCHTLSAALQNDGSVKILCYSVEKDPFEGDNGAVIDIPLTASASIVDGEYEIRIENILLTCTDKTEIKPAVTSTKVTVGNTTSLNMQSVNNIYDTIYNVNGQQQTVMQNGINIVRVDNGVVKKIAK